MLADETVREHLWRLQAALEAVAGPLSGLPKGQAPPPEPRPSSTLAGRYADPGVRRSSDQEGSRALVVTVILLTNVILTLMSQRSGPVRFQSIPSFWPSTTEGHLRDFLGYVSSPRAGSMFASPTPA